MVSPLLRNDRANTDDACEIWVQELAEMLDPQLKDQPRLFGRAREGATMLMPSQTALHDAPTDILTLLNGRWYSAPGTQGEGFISVA